MPHQALKLLPGVDVNKTPALNEAAISQSQLIRFIPDRTMGGLVQKLGGWTKYYSNVISSTVRALWAWEDTNSHSYLAVGAEGTPSGGALETILSGSISDITPQTIEVNVAVSAATTAGSNAVVITDTGRNITSYDSVDIQTQISVGGLILFGQYQCYNPGSSADTYTIYASSNAVFTTTVPSLPLTVTGASGTGSSATITFSDSYIFPVDSWITVSGMTPTGYNGNYKVTASSAGSVSYDNATTGSLTVTGTVSNNGLLASYTSEINKSVVSVTLPNHGLIDGDTYTSLRSTAFSGVNIYKNYIISNSTTDTFTINVDAPATSTTTSPVYQNNDLAHYIYYIGFGALSEGTGFGIGGYGEGGFGTGVAPVAATGTPITAIDWTLDNWGSILVACPLNGPIYQWSPSAGQPIATVIPEAPSVNAGAFVAMPQRQVIAWGTTYTGIQDPLQIRWSDVNDFSTWVSTPTNQADGYRIPKGSKIIQAIQGPQQGLIWTDIGLWAMQYVGLPYVYQFNELGTGCGLIGRKAAASINGVVYWMGPSQFYRLSTNGVEPIRCPIWDVVFQDLDRDNLDRIRVAPNSRFGEISWHFPTISNGGENDGYVKYNYVLDQWDYGFNSDANPYVARSAWINESVLGPPIGAALNNYLYQHETSLDADGNALVSYFQTGYFALSEADVKSFIDQVWPDMKWGYYGGTQGANVNLTFYTADYAGQTPSSYGPYVLTQSTTYITPRFRGRLVSIRVGSSDVGSFWRLGNIRYRLQPDGRF